MQVSAPMEETVPSGQVLQTSLGSLAITEAAVALTLITSFRPQGTWGWGGWGEGWGWGGVGGMGGWGIEVRVGSGGGAATVMVLLCSAFDCN